MSFNPSRLREITESEYDRFYQKFREEQDRVGAKLALLQQADDSYFVTANYLVQLANRASELFEGSEAEEKRQLLKLVLSNLKIEGKKIVYDLVKPFDTILSCANSTVWGGQPVSNRRPRLSQRRALNQLSYGHQDLYFTMRYLVVRVRVTQQLWNTLAVRNLIAQPFFRSCQCLRSQPSLSQS